MAGAILSIFVCCLTLTSASTGPTPIEIFYQPKVLIFCKTNGYHHASITTGIAAIRQLGEQNGFAVDTTADSTWFRPKILRRYAALIFLDPPVRFSAPKKKKPCRNISIMAAASSVSTPPRIVNITGNGMATW
jgi:hypothetical protein